MTQPAVNVDTLPGDDVYPDLIDSNAAGLRKAGKAVAARGTRVNAHWKKLGAHYGAPETESLVAKLAPAETAAATFGTRMGSAATALEAFAEEARGIKKRAEAIRARAKTFLDGVVAHGVTKQTYIPSQGGGYTKVDHERWDQDSKAVAENDAIIAEIEQLANDLEAAEARCANSITGAVGADPVTGPGTSVDWTSVPAGTATPWGVKMGHRNETNDEAIGRGMLTGLIGLETSLMAVGGWQNKTMTYDKITGGGFDPFALDHSFALQGQALLGIGKFAAGVSNLVNPVYAPLTLLGLRSKGPLGDYSRATTGTVIEGGKSFLVWDKWKNDPYAAGGELTINLLSLAIPGGGEAAAPVEVAARVGVRAGEGTAEVAGRTALDAATESTTRAGSKAAADAAQGMTHVPVGVDARTGLGHAEASPAGAPGAGERVAGMGDAPGDFSLERPPAVDATPAPRTPQHIENPEPVADRSTGAGSPDVAHKMGTPDHDARAPRQAPVHAHAPKPAEVPAAAEHPTPREQDRIEAEVPARERELVKVGATAEHAGGDLTRDGQAAVPERELVHSGAPERPLALERSSGRPGVGSTGETLPRATPASSGSGAGAVHDLSGRAGSLEDRAPGPMPDPDHASQHQTGADSAGPGGDSLDGTSDTPSGTERPGEMSDQPAGVEQADHPRGGLDETTATDQGAGGSSAPHKYSAAIFGDSNLHRYTGPTPTLGPKGGTFFVMSGDDVALVHDAASAARYTGMSPSTLKAYQTGGDVHAILFPAEHIAHRVPTPADAGGWPHYLEGGYTAVLLEGPKAGYLVNPVREFVIDGGRAPPPGSVLVTIEGNYWKVVRRW